LESDPEEFLLSLSEQSEVGFLDNCASRFIFIVKEEKFKEIYNAHYGKVIRLCLGYVTGDMAMAKDLAQDVFLKVWQHRDSFRNESNYGTWIYRITVNTCLSQLRINKKQRSHHRVNDELLNKPEEQIQDNEMLFQRLYGCIDQLSKIDKGIILLELEGLPQQEIAEITGYSHQVVRTRIHRMKQKLEKCLRNGPI
jgi:RNA polymerase sigma-70 factor (ECF subfamily)